MPRAEDALHRFRRTLSGDLTDLLLSSIHYRVASVATPDALDNLDGGLRAVMGTQEGRNWIEGPGAKWLDAALRDLASAFAEEFAEVVLVEAAEIAAECEARRAVSVAADRRVEVSC